MKSERRVKMDFGDATNKAKALREIAAQMREIADNGLAGAINNISTAWTSDSSRAFVHKGIEGRAEIKLQAERITRAADNIEAIAKRTYDAEIRAIEIARKRTYSSGGGGGGSLGGGGGGGSW